MRTNTARTSFQFTPLREGRPAQVHDNTQEQFISIHAPPRGATTLGQKALKTGAISIHAPPRGATSQWRVARCTSRNFNSRPSARGDEWYYSIYDDPYFISIHAPPRGATVHGVCWGYWNLISIHAPPRGATLRIGGGSSLSIMISIHAPPRGATERKKKP